MKKGLMLLSLLVASVTGAAHADDAAIQKRLAAWAFSRRTCSLHR